MRRWHFYFQQSSIVDFTSDLHGLSWTIWFSPRTITLGNINFTLDNMNFTLDSMYFTLDNMNSTLDDMNFTYFIYFMLHK